jgi:multiple sugar transport system permease protein
MQNAYGIADFGRIMAASTVTVLPIVVLFFFAQRTFIQGVTFTGLKG